MKTLTDTILMICPVAFRTNEQTTATNFYQKESKLQAENLQVQALKEFDTFVEKLRSANINVIVIEDTPLPSTPDSIFPNNWISFHQDGEVILYPMLAPNRRQERRLDILEQLQDDYNFDIKKLTDWSVYEEKSMFLEGTGSMILDRKHKVAYAALSERTHPSLLKKFSQHTDYQLISFHAFQQNTLPIYHTNVMMALSDDLVVICADTIKDEDEKKDVFASFKKTGKEVVIIDEAQKNAFAGNMLTLKTVSNEKLMVMSSQAYRSLTSEQKNKIETTHQILHSPLDTIEHCGGGSARCMMAEIFLQKK